MNWCRVLNGIVQEIIQSAIDPNGSIYHPSLIWVQDYTGTAQEGWIYDPAGKSFTPPLAQTLAQAQAAQIALINAGCESVLAAIIAPYPPAEIDTWHLQYNEAMAYTANPAAQTPTLSAIVSAAVVAGATGYTLAIQAASILAKAAAYTAASGAAIGKRQALTDKINAATSVAAVQAIVW